MVERRDSTPGIRQASDDLDRIRDALSHVPPDDRDTWLRVGMAIKSELGDTGFDVWEIWSQKADSFDGKDARAVWKSIRPGGGVTVGTLFYEARANGWRDDETRRKPTPEALAEGRRRAAERALREDVEIARERAATASKAAAILAAATGAKADHPYLSRKRVAPVSTLREIDSGAAAAILGYAPRSGGEPLTGRLLVVPVKRGDGISTLELIDGDKRKAALAGRGSKVGGYWATGRLPDGDGAGLTLLIGEGVATVLSAAAAAGHPAIAALSSGNLPAVAEAMRERYPKASLAILADLVKATGEPDPHAVEAARAVGGTLAIPDFGSDRDPGMTDFNDLQVLGGMGHLRRQLEAQLAAVLPAEDARPARPDRAVAAMVAPAISVPEMAIPEMGAPARRREARDGDGDGGRPDRYREVTERIIELIEAGTAPWQRSWDRARHPGAPIFPVNAATGRTYRGVNVLLLGADPRSADDPRWCGYEQARARGWQVRAGARGATIYFFKRPETPEAGADDAGLTDRDGRDGDWRDEDRRDGDGRPPRGRAPFLCRHTVFHASQIEGIPSLEEAYGPADALPAHVWEAEERLERILRRGGARIVHGGNRAYYDPNEDVIALPPRERFPDAAAYFGVAFHELGHWTGHETRLNRPFARRRDAPEYAREELRAELASAFLGAELGVRHDLERHATYLDRYLDRYLGLLRGDSREIFRASRDAQAIADLILDRHPRWQLRDGVCARRTEPPAEISETSEVAGETATASRTPEAAPPIETGERGETAAALAAPYRWALAAVSEPEARPEADPGDGLFRRVDAAWPLAGIPGAQDAAQDAADRSPARPDPRAPVAAHHHHHHP